MRISWLAVAAATVAFCGSAHATELVTNGDFTSLTNGVGQLYTNTNATGWSVANPTGYAFVFNSADAGGPGQYGPVALWDANNGGSNTWNGSSSIGSAHNFLALDGDFQTSAVQQTITGLTVGQTYTLTFDYGFSQQTGFTGPTQQNLTVSLGSQSDQVLGSNYILPSHGFSGWTSASETFTATSTSEVLSFLAYGDTIPPGGSQLPPFALVSNVSLEAAAPGPGPATGPLAVLGLLALGYARLRAREQA